MCPNILYFLKVINIDIFENIILNKFNFQLFLNKLFYNRIYLKKQKIKILYVDRGNKNDR